MRTYKKYSVFTLAIIFVASVITALSLIFGATVASAERSISLTGSTYFVTSNSASIANYEVTSSSSSDSSDSESSDDSSTNYVSFLFEDEDDAITYRKNLAFHWYSSASSSTSEEEEEESSSSSSGEQSGTEGYLSTTIGFPTITEGENEGKLPFETFTIKFQSQQYSATEDGVTTNYIRFIAYYGDSNGVSSTSTNSSSSDSNCAGVYVVIGDEDVADYTLDDIKNVKSEGTSTSCNLLTNLDKITISFVSYSRGTYTVVVTDGTYVNVIDSIEESKSLSTTEGTCKKKLADDTCVETDGTTIVEGTFTNVGGSYAKYVSSSSGTSVIPLTYSATFPEYNDPSSSSDTYAAQMVLYSFNGQSFESTTSGSSTPAVSDNTSPVVCLDEVVTTLRYGHAIDIGYTVIDMLATSPKSTLYYYVLSEEMVTAGKSDTSTTASSSSTTCSTCTNTSTCTTSSCTTCVTTKTKSGESSSGTSYNYGYNSTEGLNSAFVEVTSSTTANVIRESGSYTGEYSYACGCQDTTSDAYAYVKIYIYVADSSSTTEGYANTDYVSIDWYIDSDSLAYINYTPFIKAVNDTEGATYVYNASDNTATEEEEKEEEEEESTNYTDIVSQIVTGYNAAVQAAITEQGASAGDGNYLYLPSFEDYVSDNYTDYTSLTFSIYYLAGDDYGSSTSLSYNELTIELDNEGDYKFIIYVTDSSGNKMWYLNETTSTEANTLDSDDSTSSGTIVYISTSDLEELLEDPDNSKLKGYVPVFSFHVDYEGLSIETPTAQDIAFVGSEYTASSFDITGLSSNYEATYSLYVFDLASFVDEVLGGETISYSDFIDMVDRLFNNSAYFEYEGEILSYDEITELLKTVTNNDSTSSSNGSGTNNYTSTEIEELLEQVADNKYSGTLDISRVTTSIYFRTIKSINDIEETDADYDDYVDYAWDYSDSDSLTFVPQDDNTFYVIAVTATDNVYATDSVSAYMCISVSAAAKTLKGESNWLKNNVASVVLLCIAGAALVGIVLLLVIKPREKGDIDLIDENNEKQKTKGRFRFSRKAD